jgi:tRNA(Ile)-lysidine synthase TilS/MesJ
MVNDTAKKLGCNKVALGHHFDDAVETFMLNLFYEGRLGCFSPVTYLDRTDITVIRPLIYAPEKDIRYFAADAALPVVESRCPADGETERESMKKLLADLERNNKGLRHRIFGAMQKSGLDGYVEAKVKTYSDPKKEEF